MQIGHVIPSNPQFTSFGGACLIGGGAFCNDRQIWFEIHWSTATRDAIAANQIHFDITEL
jgi:hypothetical protein